MGDTGRLLLLPDTIFQQWSCQRGTGQEESGNFYLEPTEDTIFRNLEPCGVCVEGWSPPGWHHCRTDTPPAHWRTGPCVEPGGWTAWGCVATCLNPQRIAVSEYCAGLVPPALQGLNRDDVPAGTGCSAPLRSYGDGTPAQDLLHKTHWWNPWGMGAAVVGW